MINILNFIEQLFTQTVSSSVKMAVIVLILLCLTIPVTSRYRAGWRYYSWLAVMLVFMVPFSMLGLTYRAEIPAVRNAAVTVGEWVSDHAPAYEITEQKLLPVNSDEYQANSAPETVTYTYRKPINVKRILSLIWAAVAVMFFSVHIRRYTAFKRAIKRHIEAVTDESVLAALEAEKRDMGIKANIPICRSSVITSPMLTGFFKPLLLFPEHELSEQELRLILRHEITHYKRRDIWYQFILLVFLSLHWFNPVAYVMAKAIEIDGETSCDERVLENCHYETRVFYGEMLIGFLRRNNQKRSYLTTTFFGGKKGMKKRLNLIASEKLRKRGTAAMSALIAFAVTASVSAAAANSEYLDAMFNGDTSYIADFVQTEKQSVSDENYTLTLEQYIVTDTQAKILFSFEAHNDEAAAAFDAVDENGHATFWDMDAINFGPTDIEKASSDGYGSTNRPFEGISTDRKRYFLLFSDGIENPEGIDFYISSNKIKGMPKITFPMIANVETKSFQAGDVTIKYNPIAIEIEVGSGLLACDECEPSIPKIYFRTKDGNIKTYNQLYQTSRSGRKDDSDLYYFRAWAKAIINPGEIQSFIMNGTEYPVDDPEKAVPAEIPETLEPFTIKPYIRDYLRIPLREFCEKLGSEVTWDGETGSASFEYYGSEYVVTLGKNILLRDGVEYNLEAPFIDENGRMIVVGGLATYMNVGLNSHDLILNGEINPDAIMHVFP